MSNRLGRMPFAPEMNSCKTEIGGNQSLVTCGDLEDGTIISDAAYNPAPSGNPMPNARDQ
jgi:hypothetical protein